MGSGAVAIMTWQGETRAKVTSSSTLTEREYNRLVRQTLTVSVAVFKLSSNCIIPSELQILCLVFRDIDAGLAMGAMCIIIGIFYMCDFFVSYFARRKLLSEDNRA